MGKKILTFFKRLLPLSFLLFFWVNASHALDSKKEDTFATDFMADALYTEPVQLTRTETAQQLLELIIVRWGNNESDAAFTLSIKQQPSFMTGIKWDSGNELRFAPGETQKTVTLSFTVQAVEKNQKENLILWVESQDPSLVPARRTIVLPFHGPVIRQEKEAAVVSFTAAVCPDSENTGTPCEPDTPVYAGEPYAVQVEPENGENIAFEFRVVGPDQKKLRSHTHYRTDEPPVLKIFTAQAGPHAIEVRTQFKQGQITSGLFGSDRMPEFEGEWQPVNTFEVRNPVIHFKGFVVEPFAAVKQNPHIFFTGDINLEMAPSETKFLDPKLDMTVTGSWKRRNCADKKNTILEKSSSQIRIGFPEQIDLIKSLREPGGKTGVPFELPVEIISRTAGKAQFKYCENTDEAAFDVSFPGFYTPQKDPADFMAGYTRSPGVLSFSDNLFFQHPSPSQPFDSTDPISYYVRGPNAGFTLKVNVQFEKKSFGKTLRSGSLFFMPVTFNLAMWKAPKDRRSRFVGDPLMGFAIYGAEPGQYAGPLPVALGTSSSRKEDQTMDTNGSARTFTDTVEDLSPSTSRVQDIPDLIGKNAQDAKKILADNGFEVELQAGKPAPAPDKAFTVSQITSGLDDPTSDRKKTVKMTVFVGYAPRTEIPDIKGLSTGEAKKQLEDAGFKVTLKTRGNAPEPDKAFRTVGTQPDPGQEAFEGDTITLISFGPFQDRVAMPSLVGLSLSEARKEMEKRGLEASYRSGEPAPAKEKENIVTSQEPGPGEMVSPRSRIVIKHFDDYTWEGPMPDLAGLSVDEARKRAGKNGLILTQNFGIPAPSSEKVGMIYQQSPAAGTQVKEMDYANVTFYTRTKNQRVAAFDCTNLPGTEAFWNEAQGKPGCRCKDGYLIRKDKSGCDKPAESVSPPPVAGKKVKKQDPVQSSDLCNTYHQCLEDLMQQLQSTFMRMQQDGSGRAACEALGISSEIIQIARDAKSRGCQISGNLEQSARLLQQTASQMCRGKPQKKSSVSSCSTLVSDSTGSGNSGKTGSQESSASSPAFDVLPVKGFSDNLFTVKDAYLYKPQMFKQGLGTMKNKGEVSRYETMSQASREFVHTDSNDRRIKGEIQVKWAHSTAHKECRTQFCLGYMTTSEDVFNHRIELAYNSPTHQATVIVAVQLYSNDPSVLNRSYYNSLAERYLRFIEKYAVRKNM